MGKKLEKIFDGITFVTATMLFVLACYQVVSRYFLGTSISWTEEVMRYMNIALVMLGVYYMTKNSGFATVTVFSDLITKKSKVAGKMLFVFQIAMEVLFYVLVVYYGINLCRTAGKTLAAATRIPMYVVYVTMPLGAIMGIVNTLLKAVRNWKKVGNDCAEGGQ